MGKLRTTLAALATGLLCSLSAPAAVAVAATPAPAVAVSAPVAGAAQPVVEQTTQPGPTIDPADNERANQQKTKSKIVVGVLAVVLAGIVIWGRSIRGKRRKKSADQAKGK
ncbi:hypothetical protein FPZ12_044145 [Amycolatopsis acidicola]|uniref:Uncharacterized protein n=1 Tax=Amycolatopsis acidicola TaxID=2596893 RepID=A0A5N0UL18_9PSEU|nr:hypothetical protein [Amycolatopsis acidicola]KAA9148996.1 hypothetical protein FPZ12_044145 [Amycolatopsis acidicola]